MKSTMRLAELGRNRDYAFDLIPCVQVEDRRLAKRPEGGGEGGRGEAKDTPAFSLTVHVLLD